MGYPSHEESIEILSRKLMPADTDMTDIEAIDSKTIAAAQKELASVYVHKDILGYAASICEATRYGKDVLLGVSPRGMIALIKVAMGYAALSGRDHVLPDDIKRAAIPVLAHRLIFNNNFFHREDLGEKLITEILSTVTVPTEDIDFSRRR